MGKFRYIIVDDDYSAHLMVTHHFKKYSNYSCVTVFNDPQKALEFLDENEIDLIFLDIEMPEMNGFQFLEALKRNIFVVILTAYPNKYGLNAHNFYDKDLVFFTNKSQLLYYFPKIIARFEKLYAEKEILHRIDQLSKNETIVFPKKVNKQVILYSEICIVTVIGHDIVLKMKDGKEHIFRMSFLELQKFLPANLFFRIRRNIIINVMYVTAFNDVTICVGDDHHIISYKKNKNIISDIKTAIQALKQ